MTSIRSDGKAGRVRPVNIGTKRTVRVQQLPEILMKRVEQSFWHLWHQLAGLQSQQEGFLKTTVQKMPVPQGSAG